MLARICERWDMELPEPTPGEPWFLDWLLRSPKQAGVHLTAGWRAMSLLEDQRGDILSVREYFGGIGAQALMVEDLFDPQDHVVQDYSAAAAEHMRRALPEYITVQQADSYAPENTASADLAVLDFGDLTAHKLQAGQKHGKLLDRVFLLEPKAVVLTDIAARYLHLHVPHYEKVLGEGTCGSYEDYLTALGWYIRGRWGYALLGGFSHTWSTVMTLVPEDELGARRQGRFRPTPKTSPIGLQL